jgi:DNA-binding beta-propeller fold protein YncE
VVKVSSSGTQFTTYTCCNNAAGLAFDQQGNLWVANYYYFSYPNNTYIYGVSEISASGTVLSAGTYIGGGIYGPQGLAIDGAGNVWVANHLTKALSELAGAQAATPGAPLSPSTGIGSDANLTQAFAIAIDASGNVWVTNTGTNKLTEYIGLAAPVKTPLIGLPAAP